jgi:hypothetical protein
VATLSGVFVGVRACMYEQGVAATAALRWGELRARLPAAVVQWLSTAAVWWHTTLAEMQILVLAPARIHSLLLLKRGTGALKELQRSTVSKLQGRDQADPAAVAAAAAYMQTDAATAATGGVAAAARASYDDGLMRDAPSDLQLQWQYYLEAKQRNDARRAEAAAEAAAAAAAAAAKAAGKTGAGTNGGDGGAAGLGSNLWFDILDLTKELVQKVSQGALLRDEMDTIAFPASAATAAVRAPRAAPTTGTGASSARTPAAAAPAPAAPASSASSSSSSAASSPTPARTAAERAEAAGDAGTVPVISVQTVFPPNDTSSRKERLASLTQAYSQRHETASVSFTAKTLAADYAPSEQQPSQPKEQMQGRRRRDVPYDAELSTPKRQPAGKKKWTPPVVEVDEQAIEVVDAEDVPTSITKENKFFKRIKNNIEVGEELRQVASGWVSSPRTAGVPPV